MLPIASDGCSEFLLVQQPILLFVKNLPRQERWWILVRERRLAQIRQARDCRKTEKVLDP
jgi:hypothetical protein